MTCSGQIMALILNLYGLTTRTVTITRVVEYILSRISKLVDVKNCIIDDDNIYEKFVIASYPWVFELGLTYSPAVGTYLLIHGRALSQEPSGVPAASTPQAHSKRALFHFSGGGCGFVDRPSLPYPPEYPRAESALGRFAPMRMHLPASQWRELREDYNRATRLVRSFDEVINSIVFTSFASNLFFVCVQLYHLLGLFNGYEHTLYVTFSLIFLLSRSLAVLLIAAQVHSASLVATPSLYNVPYSSYGTEVQRFLDQIHGDTVALTGLNFFYVTKELVLSVVGTIVTYELVLVQFNR
ncbi:gustatory receptor for sugar taste 64f-like [Nymphalis io]|uniref:gustatory receptor for sugar taste 64f-like n=1 Tax=Inachis io TaxID=171585 RepID=UPI002169546E|nr:gustatory receptor for sugar taste 64f-like [Nymphalis io]